MVLFQFQAVFVYFFYENALRFDGLFAGNVIL